MPLELQQLRQMIALAEHGSFVRASAALHISQPALSRSIQNMERRFGSALFRRSASGVVPTDVGRLYIERARDLVRMADELDRTALTDGALQVGRVAVGGGPFPSESLLAPAATRFVENFPRIAVHLHAADWDELLQQLRSRTLDFFVAETSTMRNEADLEVLPMPSPRPVYFVARAGHPLAEREGVTVADVMAWPFVVPGRIPPRLLEPMLAAHRAVTRRSPAPRPFPAIHCNGLASTRRIVAASDAVTGSIPACVATELASGRLVLLGTEPWLELRYGIVSLRGRPWTQAAERFRDLVLEAEHDAVREEERLIARYAPGSPQPPSSRRRGAQRRD
jgi:DNA-binding transcriptional LysR family regulator